VVLQPGGRGANKSSLLTHFTRLRTDPSKSPARPRRRWMILRMDLQEVGWRDMDWVDLAQDRDRWLSIVDARTNFWVP